MKHAMTRTLWAMVFVFLSSTALAQMGDDPGKAGMMGDGMMEGGMEMHGMMGIPGMRGMEMDSGMMEMMKTMGATSRLDLTPEQKRKIQSLTFAHQKEAIPLLSAIRLKGVEIRELLLEDPIDLKKIEAKVKEKYGAVAKLELSHLALKQRVGALLTPEQRRRMESMMMEMGEMMGPMMEGPGKKGDEAPSRTPSPAPGTPGTTDPHGH